MKTNIVPKSTSQKLQGQHVVVVGMGKSGQSATVLASLLWELVSLVSINGS